MIHDSSSSSSSSDSQGRSPEPTDSTTERADRSSLLSIGRAIDEIQREFPEVQHSTLRYLEREGLIHPVRTAGAHRLFPPEEVRRVLQIRRWQAQGLSLDEIRARLATWTPTIDIDTLGATIQGLMVAGRFDEARQRFIDADEAGV